MLAALIRRLRRRVDIVDTNSQLAKVSHRYADTHLTDKRSVPAVVVSQVFTQCFALSTCIKHVSVNISEDFDVSRFVGKLRIENSLS